VSATLDQIEDDRGQQHQHAEHDRGDHVPSITSVKRIAKEAGRSGAMREPPNGGQHAVPFDSFVLGVKRGDCTAGDFHRGVNEPGVLPISRRR
jgi:hypothetical protein